MHKIVKIAGQNEAEVSMRVEAGVTYSLIPRKLAQQLQIVQFDRTMPARRPGGGWIEANTGFAMFEMGGRSAVVSVLIADCDEALLGVETLEALGLALDPITGALEATRGHDLTRKPPWTAHG